MAENNWLAQIHEQLGEINFAKNDIHLLMDKYFFMLGKNSFYLELVRVHESLWDAEEKLRRIIHDKVNSDFKADQQAFSDTLMAVMKTIGGQDGSDIK